MRDNKPFMNMDERSKQVAYKIIAIMYFLTIIAMQGVVLYRQFVLAQSIHDFEDIAIVDKTAYVLRNDGIIFRVNEFTNDDLKVKKYTF